MEIKKSEEANLERLRAPIFLIGFLFIGSVVLASFTIEKTDRPTYFK